MKRWLLLAVMCAALVGMCMMFDGAYGAPNMHVSEWTPYCESCDLCIMADAQEDLREVDISYYTEDYIEKQTLYNLDIEQTFEKVDVCEYDNDGKLECEKFYEMCWHWDRDRQNVVDIIPVVLGIAQTQWLPWYPTTAAWINPLTGGYIADTIWVNATVVDSNLDQVFWRMEWDNGTTAFNWIEMVGHNEVWAAHNGSSGVTGVYTLDGRNVYYTTAEEKILIDTTSNFANGRIINDDKWGRSNEIATAMGGYAMKCFRGNLENCTEPVVVNYTGITPVCDIWLNSPVASEMVNLNVSYDRGASWVNNSGWSGVAWYELASGMAGDDNGDGTYNYELWINRVQLKYYTGIIENIHTTVGGIKCLPQTSIWDNITSFYGSMDTTAHAEGSYVLRLNITNSTSGDYNVTETSNITIDNNPPTCIINAPPTFPDTWGYVSNYPITNVTATDSGSGVDEVNNTWTNTQSLSTIGNLTMPYDGEFYWNNTYISNGIYSYCAFCFDMAGKMSSACISATVLDYGLTPEQNDTLYGITATATTQDVDIIIGFFLFAGLCFLVAMMFQSSHGITSFFGRFTFLFFTGMGIFVMSLGASAIYTGWNNTDTWNSSGMGIPDTMMNLSFWGVWVWVLLIVLGLLFWLMKWFAEYKGVKM